MKVGQLVFIDLVDDVVEGSFLMPFLKLIESGSASGPIVSVALSALKRFLTYGFVRICFLVVFDGRR